MQIFPFPPFAHPYPMGNPVFMPPQLPSQTPSSVVPTPTSTSSLSSPTTPPQLIQQQPNNLSPPLNSFTSMVIGQNDAPKPAPQNGIELSPLQQIKLLQQQYFGPAIGITQTSNEAPKIEDGRQNAKSINESISPPELINGVGYYF
jgi:hypothetical protein